MFMSEASGSLALLKSGNSPGVIFQRSCSLRMLAWRLSSQAENASCSNLSCADCGPANGLLELNIDGSLIKSQWIFVVSLCRDTIAEINRFCASTLRGSRYGLTPSHSSGVKA